MNELLNISIRTKSFGEQEVLNEINFSINQGEFVSILGKSGCGKTTLLRLIIGLDTDFIGNVSFGKEDFQMGMIFQEHRLIPWLTVSENVAFALPKNLIQTEKKTKVNEILKLVGLQGYEHAWIREISGGMAQRLALARALVNLPQLMLLDEPFGALDSFTRMEMQKELLQILKQKQVASIMVTHDIEEAILLSDRIIILGGEPTSMQKMLDVTLLDRFDRNAQEFIALKAELLDSIIS